MDGEVIDSVQKMQRHGRYLPRVFVLARDWQSTHDHIRIADCLHLVNVIIADDGVEAGIQIIQEVDDLKCAYII